MAFVSITTSRPFSQLELDPIMNVFRDYMSLGGMLLWCSSNVLIVSTFLRSKLTYKVFMRSL